MIGFTCGSFDLLHAGHILMLTECKDYCDYLIVGLQVDPSVDRSEKNKPVQSLFERQIQLESVRYVDQVVVYETEADLVQVLMSFCPDRRFVSEEYRNKDFTGSEISGIEVIYNNRRHHFSSSRLRERCQDGSGWIMDRE